MIKMSAEFFQLPIIILNIDPVSLVSSIENIRNPIKDKYINTDNHAFIRCISN